MAKTIKELSENEGRVYVLLSTPEIGERFLFEAEKEGFTFGDGKKPTERHYANIMAVNPDMTINYVGTVGRIAFGCGAETVGDKKLIRAVFE